MAEDEKTRNWRKPNRKELRQMGIRIRSTKVPREFKRMRNLEFYEMQIQRELLAAVRAMQEEEAA